MQNDVVIYSINIEDVQNVAEQELGRLLTDEELKIIEDKIGDQFDWYAAIATTISTHIDQHDFLKSKELIGKEDVE